MMNYQQPRTEIRTTSYSSSNTPVAIVSGLIILVGIVLAIIYFGFSLFESLILITSLLVFYCLLLVLLISVSRNRRTRQVVSKQVIKEVEKPVVRIVEKPRTMPKPKHYKYVGSTTTKVYHQSNSRLARLIRPRNKIQSNSRAYFERLGFKPSAHIKAKLKNKK